MNPAVSPSRTGSPASAERAPARGSALILALWVLLMLALLIGSFVFEMRIAAGIVSRHRRRAKAQELARAGVEWARCAMALSAAADADAEPAFDEDLHRDAVHISRGVPVRGRVRELGDGVFRVRILPEQGRRNVNLLATEEWYALLQLGGLPAEEWDERVDCFMDWIDGDDLRRLHGAESDDPYYVERGYEVRNAPVDLISEMLLIKNFDARLLYGGPGEVPDDPPFPGIARWLTTWGDGKVHVNAAEREVFLTLPGIAEWHADSLIEGRVGIDGEPGTLDDGFEDLQQALDMAGLDETYRDVFIAGRPSFVRVVSEGEVDGLRYAVWAVFFLEGERSTPVFWREEPLP